MITLRPYQQHDIDNIRSAFIAHKRVLYTLPTGGGKGTIAAYIAQGALAKNKQVRFVAHRKRLLSQLEQRFIADNIYGVQFSMMQTLQNNLATTPPPDFLIIDEAHTAASNGYKKILDWAGDIPILSLTATPERLDGKGLSDVADTMVTGLSIRELIDAGYLCDYEILSLPDNTELNPQEQYADLVQTYRTHAHNEKGIVMCKDIHHAMQVATAYQQAGYTADALYSELPDDAQDKIMDNLTSGKLRIVANVNMLVEGIDIPDISFIQWAARTDSLIRWQQGNGRGFRIAHGKKRLIILDHVGNLAQHGLPCMKREWQLEGKKAREKAEADAKAFNVRECGDCYSAYPATKKHCPYCGALPSSNDKTIKVLKGELIKIDKAAYQHELKASIKLHGKEKAIMIDLVNKNPDTAPMSAMFRFNRGGFDKALLTRYELMRDEILYGSE
jgi:superfamily II DNA or RNA helicase